MTAKSEILTSVWDHVEDLRWTLIKSLVWIVLTSTVTIYYHQDLIQLLLQGAPPLAVFSPTEGIVITFKVCLYTSLFLSAPFWLWEVLKFISPALKENERRIVIPFFLTSIAFMITGCFLACSITIPLSNQYLMSFNATMAQNLWGLSEYLDYTFLLMLAHGFAFECGVLLLLLVHLGLIKDSTLIKGRRYSILGSFILAALLTPPDVFSQVMLALPLIGFYEMAIGYAKTKAYFTRT